MIRKSFFAIAAWMILSSLALDVRAADGRSLDALIEKLARDLQSDRLGETASIAQEIAELKYPAAIPKLIGIIDSDNSYRTIYGVGYFALGGLTGVEYDPIHHGPWWRKWWAVNKKRFPKEVQDIPIPTYPHTRKG